MPSEALYLRGDIWWCRVRNAAGRIVRKSTHCRDRAAAIEAFRNFERAATDSTYAAATETRLDAAVTSYVAELRQRGCAAATLRKEATKAGVLLRVWGVDWPLSAINAQLVADFIAKREGEGVTRHTVKMELGTLTRVLKVAIHYRRFHLKLAEVLPIQYGAKHKPRTRWLTRPELDALCRQLPRHRAAHVAFIVATGARRSEAEAARLSDVNEARTLVHLRGTKTASAEDDVPVTKLMEDVFAFALDNAPGKDRLFSPWSSINHALARACVRAGIAKCSPNDLRRTFGKWHRGHGVDPSTIGPMLRHTTDKLAQTTYAAARGEELRGLVEGQLRGLPAPSTLSYRGKPGAVTDTRAPTLYTAAFDEEVGLNGLMDRLENEVDTCADLVPDNRSNVDE